MGKSYSNAHYERFRTWRRKHEELQQIFSDFYDLEYLGADNMTAILTAPEFIEARSSIRCYRKLKRKQAESLLANLQSGRFDRGDALVWIEFGVV